MKLIYKVTCGIFFTCLCNTVLAQGMEVPPAINTLRGGDGALLIIWNDPADDLDAVSVPAGYQVVVTRDGMSFDITGTACADAATAVVTQCLLTGLVAGSYAATVATMRANNDIGTPSSSRSAVVTTGPQLETEIINAVYNPDNGRVTVTWRYTQDFSSVDIRLFEIRIYTDGTTFFGQNGNAGVSDIAPCGGIGNRCRQFSQVYSHTINAAALTSGIYQIVTEFAYLNPVTNRNSFTRTPPADVRKFRVGPEQTPQVTLNLVSDTLNIAWVDPDDASDPAVKTGYDVVVTRDGGTSVDISGSSCATVATTPSATSCSLSLTSVGVFEVTVATIRNFEGPGQRAAPQTLAVSEDPPQVSISLDSDILTIEWIDPPDIGDPASITGYDVVVMLDGELFDITGTTCQDVALDARATSCTLEEASVGDYDVTVTTLRDVGPGQTSDLAMITVDETNEIEASASLLGDVGQNLVGQLVDSIGDRLGSGAGTAAANGSSFISLGGKVLTFDESINTLADSSRELDLNEPETFRELLGRNAVSFGLSGGGGGVGSSTLWGRADLQRFEGRTKDDITAYDGDLFSGTLGYDFQMSSRALIGVGVTASTGDGTVGASSSDISMFTVHPYIRYTLSETTDVWGQVGYGNGDLKLTDSEGAVISDEDFELGFAAIGGRTELSFIDDSNIALVFKEDAQVVNIKGKRDSRLDSDSWRVRMGLEASMMHDLPEGGVLQPSAELGVRYDGGDTQEGLGVYTGASLRMEDAATGLTIEGRGSILLAHHESSKQQWNIGGIVSFDVGTVGRGLAISVEPSYGAAVVSDHALWSDKLEVADHENNSRLLTTVGYGAGALGGIASVTPYGRLELGGNIRKMREGLLMELSSEKLRLDIYAEQQIAQEVESRTENSVNLKLALDF